MTLTCQIEPFEKCIEEGRKLIDGHFDELALDKEIAPLDPNYREYFRRSELGSTVVACLRDSGRLVGYFVTFVAPGLHYQSCLTAHMDIAYVHPAVRGRHGGVRLIRTMLAELKRRGVDRVFAGCKLHSPDWGNLLQAVGFRPIEMHYSKILRE